MKRYTTPTHTWKFTENPENYSVILVTYAQAGNVLLQKNKSDMSITSEVIEGETVYFCTYTLSQEETARFAPGTACVQMQALTNDGAAVATGINELTVEPVLNEGVIA